MTVQLLDENYIISELQSVCNHIQLLQTTTSTQVIIKQQQIPDNNRFNLCIAEHQSKGKGRKQRTWVSPVGENIYFSLAGKIHISNTQVQLSSLPLLIALALCHTLDELDIHDVMIKWPNDIYIKNKKLAGILVDIISQSGRSVDAIIGIGINVNMHTLQDDALIDQAWTSLLLSTGRIFNRSILLTRLVNKIIRYISVYEVEGFSYFYTKWCAKDYLQGKKIQIVKDDKISIVEVLGINLQGALCVEDKGVKKILYSEEVSVVV